LCTGTSTGSFTLQGNNGNAPYSFTLNGTTNTSSLAAVKSHDSN
jgi:hypothetical protein